MQVPAVQTKLADYVAGEGGRTAALEALIASGPVGGIVQGAPTNLSGPTIRAGLPSGQGVCGCSLRTVCGEDIRPKEVFVRQSPFQRGGPT